MINMAIRPFRRRRQHHLELMTHPSLPGLFHTGMIVKDLKVAMTDMTEAFSLEWAPPTRASGEILVPGGSAHHEVWLSYSLEGPHHIELIEQVDNTAWREASGGPIVHHLGFSVKDLPSEVARLASIGYVPEVSGRGRQRFYSVL